MTLSLLLQLRFDINSYRSVILTRNEEVNIPQLAINKVATDVIGYTSPQVIA